MPPLTNAQTRDVETLIHPYTNLDSHRNEGPMILETGEGIYVRDTEGKQYLEGMAGLWCTSLGYGNEELIEAAREQLSKLSFTHIFGGKSHDAAIALAEKLKEISPAPASKIFFTCSGSEANDTQIKLAWYYNNARGKPEKKKFISRQRGYHGVTIATASLTGLPANHADFDLPIDRILHTGCPHHYRCAKEGESEDEFSTRLASELDELIQKEGPETVAAFIAEPVMGAGGVVVPPESYFGKIQEVLTRYDVLFIVDEVICGFGRTGEMFGSQTFGIKPDTISVAKALTSAYAPLGAITVSEDVYQAMLDESRKIGTFGHGYKSGDRILHTGCPHHYRCANEGESEDEFSTRLASELDELIQKEGPETVAAFIAEPVMGAGGVVVPPESYFGKIQEVLTRYDVLFIVDEVICGFGRTGEMFGSQTFGIKPDTISVAKALTSAYAPLGAITVSEDVYQAMLDESRKIGTFGHGYTYSGHPLSTAIGLKTLEIYERDNIVGHVKSVAPIFQSRLKALASHDLVGEARGVGLIGGVELVADKATKKPFDPKQGVAAMASRMCQEEGLIVRAIASETLAMCPPLIITQDQVNELFDCLERGLDRTRDHLKAAA